MFPPLLTATRYLSAVFLFIGAIVFFSCNVNPGNNLLFAITTGPLGYSNDKA